MYADPSNDSPEASGSGGSGDKGKQQKKEIRVGRACDSCRKAKVRCPDGSPDTPCGRCKASSTPCTFEQKPTKRGPPRGYVESLERRLEAMEGLLRALSASSENDGGADLLGKQSDDSDKAEEKSNRLDGTEGEAEHGFDLGSVDRLAREMEDLSVDKDRYVGRGSGLHLAKSIRVFSQNGAPASATDLCPPIEDDAFGSIVELMLHEEHREKSKESALPDADLSEKLIEAYFEMFNSDQPLLHRPSFNRAIKEGKLTSDPSFRSLFFMVLAVGARFVEDPRLDVNYEPFTSSGFTRHTRGFNFFKASSESATPPLMSATLYDIQCSCLLIFWLLGAATPISAWAAVGFAIRRMVDVGAHRENRMRWNASPLEDQLRRRTFHTLFGMDRMLSSSLGRPLAIHEEDIDLIPALDISDADLDSWNARGPLSRPPSTKTPGPLAAMRCLYKLQSIVGKGMRLLYGMNRKGNEKAAEAVCELDSLLNEWLTQIPDHLKWDPATQDKRWLGQSALIYSTYYCCQILCHRDFISPSRARLHAFPSLAICSNAARSCSHVLDYAARHGKVLQGFYYIPLASVTSGLILLINVFAKGSVVASLSSSAMSDVRKCISVLQILGDGTFLAQKCGFGLAQLADLASTLPVPKTAPTNLTSSTNGKRPSPCDSMESPNSAASSSSPAASTTTEGEEVDGYQNKKKRPRRVEILPLTTDDLSLGTFIGRPTFLSGNGERASNPPATNYGAQLPPLFPPPSETNYFVPNPLSTTESMYHASSSSSPSMSLPEHPPVLQQHQQQYHQPQQQSYATTWPSQSPQDYTYNPSAFSPQGGGGAYAIPNPQLNNQQHQNFDFTPSSTLTNGFDWSNWGVSNEEQFDWDAVFPAFAANAMGGGSDRI